MREVKKKKMANNVQPRISIPNFDSSGDGYRIYREEVILWAAVCGLEKKNLGAVLWLQLARADPSNINDPGLACLWSRPVKL